MRVKTIFKVFWLCFLSGLPLISQAAAVDVGLQYGGASGLGTKDIRITTAEILNTALGLIGIIIVLIVLISGIYFMVSKGDPEKKAKAKKILISGAIGLVIILAGYSLTSYILSTIIGASGPGQSVNSNETPVGNVNQSPAGTNQLKGDADGDGGLTGMDTIILNNLLNGQPAVCRGQDESVIDCQTILDLDGDGAVTVLDKNLLLNLIYGGGLPNYLKGDADGDGYVAPQDITIMQKYINGVPIICHDQNNLVIDCKIVLDLNNDGYVDPLDLDALRQIYIGAANYIKGDADGDGYVQTSDLATLRNYLVGLPAVCFDQNQNQLDCKLVLDINGDGLITPSDLTAMSNIVNGQQIYIQGDADGDGLITANDLRILSDFLSGQVITCHDLNNNEIDCLTVLDFDGDGNLGGADLDALNSLLSQ